MPTTTHTYDAAKMNVFSGENGLIDYFNPDKNPPLPLVELPPQLNPFYDDGVRVYAKMLTALPATNVKSLPGESCMAVCRRRRQAWCGEKKDLSTLWAVARWSEVMVGKR